MERDFPYATVECLKLRWTEPFLKDPWERGTESLYAKYTKQKRYAIIDGTGVADTKCGE